MTISALFVRSLEDGTAVYMLKLDDPEHLDAPITVQAVCFDGEIVLAEPVKAED